MSGFIRPDPRLLAIALCAAALLTRAPARAARDGDGSCACERAAESDPSSDVSLVVRVLTRHADPIEGATVAAGCVGDDELSQEGLVTDGDGCACTRRRCARPALVIGHPGYLQELTYDVAPTETGRGSVTMLLTEGAVISGVVLGAGDRPVGGVDVLASRTGRSGPVNAFARTKRGEVEDPANGTFELVGLAGGSWRLSVSGGGITPVDYGDVVVAAGERVSGLAIHARDGVWITGRVLDERGVPVAGASVRTEAVSNATDRDGRFALGGLPAGLRVLQVDADGFESRTVDRVFAGSGSIDVRLRPLGAWQGRVVDADSREPPALFRVNGTDFLRTDGKFTVKARNEQDGEMVVAAADHVARTIEVPRAPIGETIQVGTIELRRGASIRGTVVDAFGSPRGGLQVRAFRGASAAAEEAGPSDLADDTSAEDGGFRLRGLSDGTWTIVVPSAVARAEDFQTTVDISDGADVSDVRLTVPSASP